MATASPTTARLKTRYNEEIRPALMERFGYSTSMQAPRIVKITVNMGCGDAKQDSKVLDAATEQLGDDHRPEAQHPPRAQVDRPVQGPRGHAGGRRGRRCAASAPTSSWTG